MSDSVVQAAISAYVKQITENTDPLAIYLFGSFARGEASVESDIDLLAVYLNQAEAKHAQRTVMRLPSPYSIAADLVFMDLESCKGERSYSPLACVVKDEGRLVFGSESWLAESAKQ